MEYTIIERRPFKVIGVRRVAPYGGGTWDIVKNNGINERMNELCGKYFDLGLCFGFDEDGHNDYMCGIEWDDYDFLEFDSFEYPAATWLRFIAKGTLSDNILGRTWREINEKFLPESKYKKADLPTIEKYLRWDEVMDQCEVEIWVPIDERDSSAY